MKSHENIKRIAGLLTRLSGGILTDAEAEILRTWRIENPGNEKIYQEVLSGELWRRKIDFAAEHDLQQAYLEFLALAAAPPPAARNVTQRPGISVKRRKMNQSLRWAATAAVVVIFAATGWFLSRHNLVSSEQELILPGSAKAILTLADGRTYPIGESEHLYNELAGIGTAHDSNYSPTPKTDDSFPVYNTITVPRGGEYFLILEDGTGVYLNAESQIQIPVPFERTVRVSGEVFFEVKSDSRRPFRVITEYGEIRVTGTSFNVREYENEAYSETALVEGSVTLLHRDRESSLYPGQRYRRDKTTGEITIEQVDTRQYTAWKDGRFIFEGQRLEDIMNTMVRWYDIEVNYQHEELKEIVFTGNIRKYDDWQTVLKMIRLVNKVEITNSGRQVFIRPADTSP